MNKTLGTNILSNYIIFIILRIKIGLVNSLLINQWNINKDMCVCVCVWLELTYTYNDLGDDPWLAKRLENKSKQASDNNHKADLKNQQRHCEMKRVISLPCALRRRLHSSLSLACHVYVCCHVNPSPCMLTISESCCMCNVLKHVQAWMCRDLWGGMWLGNVLAHGTSIYTCMVSVAHANRFIWYLLGTTNY
jgi:hypothetical protein